LNILRVEQKTIPAGHQPPPEKRQRLFGRNRYGLIQFFDGGENESTICKKISTMAAVPSIDTQFPVTAEHSLLPE
jgi:hypothetical protein